jgi:hypothetical protein
MKGKYPKGKCPKGKYPKGKYPKGKYPKGKYPKGKYPKGKYLKGTPLGYAVAALARIRLRQKVFYMRNALAYLASSSATQK